MHQSVKLTDAIWLLQLVISSPLIHALGEQSQAPIGIRTWAPSWRCRRLTNWAIPPPIAIAIPIHIHIIANHLHCHYFLQPIIIPGYDIHKPNWMYSKARCFVFEHLQYTMYTFTTCLFQWMLPVLHLLYSSHEYPFYTFFIDEHCIQQATHIIEV